MPTYADDLNRANSSTITTGAPYPWTEVEDNSEILSNAMHAVSVGGATLTTARMDQDVSSNQTVSCTIRSPVASPSANELSLGVALRYSSSAATYYAVMADCQNASLGTSTILIKKSIAGVYTNISTGTAITMADGDLLTATIQNSTITVYYNGVQKVQITDTAITSGNRAGVAMYRAATAADGSVDNFSVGALATAATPLFVCGAECGLAAVGTLGVGTEHWSSISGAPSVVTSGPTPMRSTRCFRFNAAGAITALTHTYTTAIASPATIVGRCYMYFATLPGAAADTQLFGDGLTSAGVFFHAADSTLRAVANGVLAGSGVAVTTGQWYLVDFKLVRDATATCDIQVNGVAGAQASSGTVASNSTNIFFGVGNTITMDLYMDDVIASGTPADYPIGSGTVAGLYPNGDGTHLYSATTDFSKAGTALTACAFPVANETTSWQSLAKPLSTSIDNTKFVTDAGGASTEYLEWTFDDLPSAAQVNGLMVVSTNHAATATADNVTLRLVDGGTTNDIFTTADFSEITIVTAVKTYSTAPSTSAAWTKTLVDALKMRWGLSTDISPTPRLDGLVFEVDYVPAPVAARELVFQAVQRAATR